MLRSDGVERGRGLRRLPPPAPLQAQGLDNPAARLFSNPAGDYGSMVNERVGTSSWENGDELGDTWASRNAYSYGRG